MSNLQGVARRMGRDFKRIVAGLVLAAWTGGWGLVAVVGWAASSAGILNAGLTMIAAGWLGFFGTYFVSRSRLRARAESSLIARAQLHELSLTDNMLARLHLFDDAWLQLQPSLNDPSLPHADRRAELSAELTSAQTQLFQLAERHMAVRDEIQALGQYAETDMILASRHDKREELARIDEEAESLVKETRALASTAEEVRALAAQSSTPTDRIKDAVEQFNLTLAAYREVEGTIAASDAARKGKAKVAEGQRA